MRCKLLIILLSLLVFTAYGQKNENRPAKWAQPVTELSLSNMYKVDEGVYRAEQPDKKEFAELERFGVREVLNLRYWHSDTKEAKGTGINLHRVSMNAHDINNKDVIDALRIIKNRKGSIVFHCKHGSDRTGVVCAMYRIIFQGWSKEDAIDEMKNGRYGFHSIYSNIPNYIKNADIEGLRKQINDN